LGHAHKGDGGGAKNKKKENLVRGAKKKKKKEPLLVFEEIHDDLKKGNGKRHQNYSLCAKSAKKDAGRWTVKGRGMGGWEEAICAEKWGRKEEKKASDEP